MIQCNIVFGLEFDQSVYTETRNNPQLLHLGPNGLLALLEAQFGISYADGSVQYIRVEQYRQCLEALARDDKSFFYRESFINNQRSTAEALLNMRDELVLSGWNGQLVESGSERLRTFSKIESRFAKLSTQAGIADRFQTILKLLNEHTVPIHSIEHIEPFEYLPTHIKRCFQSLSQSNCTIKKREKVISIPSSDLGKMQVAFQNRDFESHFELQNDGSFSILKAAQEYEAASGLLFSHLNLFQKTTCLVSKDSLLQLEQVGIKHGFPSLGVGQPSDSRPALQILKLLPAFIWKPIDTKRVLEFLTLPLKPLDETLSQQLAAAYANSPGFKSREWKRAVQRFLFPKEQEPPTSKIKKQYFTWFKRKRYDLQERVPIKEVRELVNFIRNWAYETYRTEGTHTGLLMLSGLGKRASELLDILPQQSSSLSALQLDRIISAIYEDEYSAIEQASIFAPQHISSSSAFADQPQDVIWWNCCNETLSTQQSVWTKTELKQLAEHNITIQSDRQKAQLALWNIFQPIQAAQTTCTLVIPDTIQGDSVSEHPIFSYLHSICNNISIVEKSYSEIIESSTSTKQVEVKPAIQADPLLELNIDLAALFLEDDFRMGPTTLEKVLFYPHIPILERQFKLQAAPIHSIVDIFTLKGRIAHAVFEELGKQKEIHDDESALRLAAKNCIALQIEQSAQNLLEYGREPERLRLEKLIIDSVVDFFKRIRNDGWTFYETEKWVEGKIGTIKLGGFIDCVLEKNGQLAIVDFKAGGKKSKQEAIDNQEDVQLISYSEIYDSDQLIPTAYYILVGQKPIARDGSIFSDIPPTDDSLQAIQDRIKDRILETYQLRMTHLKNGVLPLHTETNADVLDQWISNQYAAQILDCFPMKAESHRYDPFASLVEL